MKQTWENGKKNQLILDPILACLAQIWAIIYSFLN